MRVIHKPLFPVIKSELLRVGYFCLHSDYNGGKTNVCLFSRSHSQLNAKYQCNSFGITSLSTAHTKDLIIVCDLAVVLIYERARYVDEFLNLHFNKMFLSLLLVFFFLPSLVVDFAVFKWRAFSLCVCWNKRNDWRTR